MNFPFLKDGFFCLVRIYFIVVLVDEDLLLISVLYLKKTKPSKPMPLAFPLFCFVFFILGNFAGSFESSA